MSLTPAQYAAQKKWREKNKAKVAAYAKAWRARNPEQSLALIKKWQQENPDIYAHSVRRCQYRQKFGITVEQYDALLAAQKGACAICSQPPGKRRLAVDHCHTTKAVRGLLCVNCNTAIGKLNDDPVILQRAIDYLFFYQ